MDRILRGIMKYRRTDRKTMVEQFQQVRDNPKVSSKSDININTSLFTKFKQKTVIGIKL